MQQDLFPAEPAAPAVLTGLFAEVVFDRPLDHAFTYAVGADLAAADRRRQARPRPLRPRRQGRSSATASASTDAAAGGRAVKAVLAVLDEEPLLTDHLLRLTRWMADYYLCGWGQVLNAVVPAGAATQAGTAPPPFVEAVPEAELAEPPPTLPRQAGRRPGAPARPRARPIEVKQLQRQADVRRRRRSRRCSSKG